jgi:hypothetical protein
LSPIIKVSAEVEDRREAAPLDVGDRSADQEERVWSAFVVEERVDFRRAPAVRAVPRKAAPNCLRKPRGPQGVRRLRVQRMT